MVWWAVKGKRYLVPVVESFLDWSHGVYEYIEEIYLPEIGVAFNERGYVFRTGDERYKSLKLPSGEEVHVKYLGDVDIDEKDIEVIKEYLEYKEIVNKIIKKYIEMKN